jgi:hypothetical protein
MMEMKTTDAVIVRQWICIKKEKNKYAEQTRL